MRKSTALSALLRVGGEFAAGIDGVHRPERLAQLFGEVRVVYVLLGGFGLLAGVAGALLRGR